MNCPNCQEELSERGSFCKACAAQARCRECRELLEPAAMACVECGAKIGSVTDPASKSPSQNGSLPANRNTITFHEDRNSRRLEASLTDNAMTGLGDVFAEVFAQRGVGRVGTQNTRIHSTEKVIDLSKQLPETGTLPTGATSPKNHQDEKPLEQPTTHHTDRERLLQIFSTDGETIEVMDNRLKATSAAEYYKRLTYLFVYAQEILLKRPAAPKAELITILKVAKVYDPNCSFWLKQKKGFTVDEEGRIKLNAGAKEYAVKTITEISDSNVPDLWNPDTRSKKPRSRKKS
jgi:hypothetical protein